jgi:tetratricopeptide (TPR) repeat protein
VIARLLRGRLGPTPALGVVGAHLRGAQQLPRAVIADFADAERALAIHANAPAAELFARATADLERLRAKADRIALSRAGDGLAAWGAGNVPAAFAAAEGTTAALASALSWPVRARIVGAIVTGKRHWLSPRFALALVRQAALRSELGYFAGNLVDIMVGGLVVSRLSDDREALQLARTRSLGLLALGVGLFGFKRGALAIFGRCQRANDHRLPAAYAFCAEALYHFANGAWREGDRCIASSEARLGSPRDFHLYGALLCVRALSLHMRGETGEAIAAFDALHQLGKQRDNRQFEAWALYGIAMPLIATGRFAEAEAKVAAASAMMEGIADSLSTLNCRALGSQLAWIRGDAAAAIDQAELCLDLARTIFPANFGSLDGFTLPALVLADIIAATQSAPELSARARNLMPAALAQSRRFASRCPIGGPRLAATHAELTRSNALRRRHQDRMERLALKLGMPAQLLHAIPLNPKPAVSAIQS